MSNDITNPEDVIWKAFREYLCQLIRLAKRFVWATDERRQGEIELSLVGQLPLERVEEYKYLATYDPADHTDEDLRYAGAIVQEVTKAYFGPAPIQRKPTDSSSPF